MGYNKRVLIISNNALSLTSNNGKTVWSLFEDYPKEKLYQLFTRDELPSLEINRYFRITTKDVIRGRIFANERGNCIGTVSAVKQEQAYNDSKSFVKRTSLTCLAREICWVGGWKSKKLDSWLNEIKPDIIFFVAGDTLYSYSICNYIADKTKASIGVYVTDDYISKRSRENLFDLIKRRLVFSKMKHLLSRANCFFTISEKMRSEYKAVFEKDSFPIFNISERLIKPIPADINKSRVSIVYAGSLYYGRDQVLIRLASALVSLNAKGIASRLEVYSNQDPEQQIIDKLTIPGISCYGGALSRNRLIDKLNEADVLLFVESFESEQIEKTRLSFSTKISEYLSVGKPIVGVGPSEVASMEFLSDVAICVNNLNELESKLQNILESKELRITYGEKALQKYDSLGDFHVVRTAFIENLTNDAK